MKTKYYLNSVELVDNQPNGQMYYECLYSNGIRDITEVVPVNLHESINIPSIINYEN
jgi:hypothetical protein